MTRRVFLLMGIAIFAVVLTHAASWGQIAMVIGVGQYHPVVAPNLDVVGSLAWDIMVCVRKVVVWAAPAFLFCSGFFVAYAARNSRGVYTWKMTRARLIDLLIPYTIWSLVWFAANAIEHGTLTLEQYLGEFIVGNVDGGAGYFIPLLCQFYLLSPLIVPMARARPKLLIATAALIQFAGLSIRYLEAFGVVVSPHLAWATNMWPFFIWATYFTLGLVCGFHSARLKQVVLRYKWVLIGALLLFGIVSVFESEWIFWSTATIHDVRYVPLTFSAWLYSIAFILAFLVFDGIVVPFPAKVQLLASRSYGIYLVHFKAMSFMARIIQRIAPWLLGYQVLFTPIMLIAGLGVPLLFMHVVSHSPARRFYHYLFG
jgi:membrane-bound acyltransferase YfiQ involved in biofilm formation